MLSGGVALDAAVTYHDKYGRVWEVSAAMASGPIRCRRASRGRKRRRRHDDGEAAERAGGVGAEPHVNVLGVEAVAAPGEEAGLKVPLPQRAFLHREGSDGLLPAKVEQQEWRPEEH
uniref:Uncharacterized protein n=1 Tax=Oryza rufipogon TaxID=4529 RepID=A0A0E0RBJ9_ORYRU